MSSPPTVAGGSQRVTWVDALRVAAIAGVIVVHTATAYVTDFADWYYDDELDPSTAGFVVFAVPALLGGIFGLGPLFWLAGWFSVPSVRRRGPRRLATARLTRLGIPLLFFVVVVNPLSDLVGNVRQEHRSFLAYLRETEFSVMWFVAALLFCSLAYAAARAVKPSPVRRSSPATTVLVAAGVLIGVLAVLTWPTTSLLDEHLMSLRPGAWIQAIVLFALGAAAGEAARPGGHRPQVDVGVSRTAERAWGWTTLIGFTLVVAVMGWISAAGELNDALHVMGWPAMVFALTYGVASVSFTLWSLAWFSRRRMGATPLLRRAGRASYATYLFHPLVLTTAMVALSPLPGGAEVKFLTVAAVAVPVCFAAGYAAVQLPVVRTLL